MELALQGQPQWAGPRPLACAERRSTSRRGGITSVSFPDCEGALTVRFRVALGNRSVSLRFLHNGARLGHVTRPTGVVRLNAAKSLHHVLR